MTISRHLNHAATTVRIDVAGSVEGPFAPVLRFFRHSLAGAPAREPQFVVEVGPHGGPLADPDAGEPVDVRRSTAPEFTFTASRAVEGDETVYVNEHTTVRLPRTFAATGNVVRLGVTERSVVQAVDLIRDLVVRHEELLGTVVLHAAAVARDDGVIAIAGRKGAGKTTTLLRLLERGDASYFSGDKLFCAVEDGRLGCLPWRDWPYVGAGTLRATPRLAALVEREVPGLAARDPRDKLLLDPDRFESWIGADFAPSWRPLRAVLLPSVRPGEPTRARRVTDPTERFARALQLVDRSADTSFFPWQTFLVPDYRAVYETLARLRPLLEDVDMVLVEGDLDVPLDQLVEPVAVA